MQLDALVCHLSWFEAQAYARFRGARRPSEAEWEMAARTLGGDPRAGNFVESGLHDPAPDPGPGAGPPLRQLWGDVWESSSSGFAPYPG